MNEPKLFQSIPRGPVNALTREKFVKLEAWISANANKHEAERATYAAIADRAKYSVGFTVTESNIEGIYRALNLPAPCRRRPKPEAEDVRAMLRTIANEVARQCRQPVSKEFVERVLIPLKLDKIEQEMKEFNR